MSVLKKKFIPIVTHSCMLSRLNWVQPCAIPLTVACQAPLSMGFSGQEYGVDCHALLQGIFPIQGWNQGLLHCRWILYCLSHQGSLVMGVTYFFISPKISVLYFLLVCFKLCMNYVLFSLLFFLCFLGLLSALWDHGCLLILRVLI